MASSSAAKLEANGGDMGPQDGECDVKPDHPIAGLSPEKCYLNVIPEARSKFECIYPFVNPKGAFHRHCMPPKKAKECLICFYFYFLFRVNAP